MAYRQVDPRINDPSINPADRNNMAIAAGYTGYENYLDNRGSTQGAYSGGGVSSADSFLQELKDELARQFDELTRRTEEFDKNNPFTFDEIMARKSAEERYNPYYDAELKDFTQGIERQKQSTEGSMKLLTDLNRIQVGQDKRNLDDAISAAEEGYAGAGLYFSGAKEKAVGSEQIQGQDTANTRNLQFNESLAGGQRSLSEIAQNQATGIRRMGAEQQTNIQTEIEKQKAEEEARHATERLQYIGSPYTSSIQGGINQLLTQTWQ